MKSKSILDFFQNISNLKQWFIMFARLDKKYEAHKIWARWLITHLSLRPQPDNFLPTQGIEYDLQIINELNNKSNLQHYEYSCMQYRAFVEIVNKIAHQLTVKDTKKYKTNSYRLKIVVSEDNDYIHLNCGNFPIYLNRKLYQKISTMYLNTELGMPGLKNYYIWHMLNYYRLLDGVGLQWSIPPKLFDYLKLQFGCDTELFASPINSYYQKYYSLYDVDKKFGSKGNFFTAPDSDFKSGSFQVNPPFIDIVFTKTSQKIIRYLEIAEQNEQDLTFIYILPDWKDLSGYDMLINSKFCNKSININANDHFYYQSYKNSYIRVYFNTKVLIMSTLPDICPFSVRREIINCFKTPMIRN